MAETRERNPMSLINELAHFNKIQHQCMEVGKDGRANKTVHVKFKLGEEEYFASGSDLKKARVAAAAVAVRETKYSHPPVKQGPHSVTTVGNGQQDQQSQSREHHQQHRYPQQQKQQKQQVSVNQNEELRTMTQSFQQLQMQQTYSTPNTNEASGFQPGARHNHVKQQQYDGRHRNQRQHHTNGHYSSHQQQYQSQSNKVFQDSKTDPSFMERVTEVTEVTSQPILGQIKRKCLAMAGWTRDYQAFPGSWPVTMNVDNIGLLTQKPYKVSWKADGTRYLMLVNGKDKVFLIDRRMNVFHVPNLNFYKKENLNVCIADTLLDGEHIIDRVGGQDVPKYLVYDIIKFQGQDVGNFDQRLQCITREIIGPRHTKLEQGTLDRSREPFIVRNKKFFDITRAHELLRQSFVKSLGHEVDGLIFQPVEDPYYCGNCYHILKWKPPSQNTIDFRLQLHFRGNHDIKGRLLVVAQRKPPLSDYKEIPIAEIKVTKDLRKYNNRIIECSFNEKQQTWQFNRERTDKDHPNGYNTAMRILESIRNPLTKESLLHVIATQQPLSWRRTGPPQLRTH